jgi:arginine decarboxylase
LNKLKSKFNKENQLSKKIDAYLKENFAQFHSPAHCGNLYDRDLSEVDGLDDLQNPCGVLDYYQKKTAELFQAQKSFFLVNGASQGLQAACLALKLFLENKKDTRPVLVARNIHKASYFGLILSGLDVQWFEPQWHSELGIYTRLNISEKIEDKFSALLITNPSYEGFYSQIPKLKIPIIVDEAHGAHYHFSEQLAKPALAYGADLVVQSWHKTLGSLTQTGAIHLGLASKIPSQFLEAALKLVQTTSPSYLLLESLCLIVEQYSAMGEEIIANTIQKAKFINEFKIKNDDPLRVLLKVPGWSGAELDEVLMLNKISCEQVLRNSVLAFVNPGNSQNDIYRLNNILLKLKSKNSISENFSKPEMSLEIFNPRKIFFEEQKININSPCPPGIII